MEDLTTTILAKFAAPFFFPVLSSQRIFVPYLLSAALLAFGVYYLHRSRKAKGDAKAGGWSFKGFLSYCFPASVYLHPSAVVDYKYFIINKISFALIFAPWIVGAAAVSELVSAGLSATWESPGLDIGLWSAALVTILAILAMDLGLFIAHYLQHKVPFLWEFHKVHHSAEVMTPITVYRMHPVDDLLAGTLVGLLMGLVEGLFLFLHGVNVSAYQVLGLNVFLFFFYLVGYNLRHSHIWLAYPPAVSRYLVSPAQHQIHHSSAERHWDRNMGFIFAFWDRLCGTLYVPEGKEELEFGLDGNEHKAFDSVWALYSRPFKVLFARRRSLSDAKP